MSDFIKRAKDWLSSPQKEPQTRVALSTNGPGVAVPADNHMVAGTYTHLYELHGLKDFMVENFERGANGEQIYCVRHIPTKRLIKLGRETFEFFFRKTHLL